MTSHCTEIFMLNKDKPSKLTHTIYCVFSFTYCVNIRLDQFNLCHTGGWMRIGRVHLEGANKDNIHQKFNVDNTIHSNLNQLLKTEDENWLLDGNYICMES